MLDNNGNTLAEETGVKAVDVTIQTNSTKTIYTFAGDWLPAIGALIASILLVKHALIRKPSKKSKKKTSKHSIVAKK